jgi:hypothetical protein
MMSSGMLRRVALVSSSETSALTRATRRNIPKDTIRHSHRRESLKSYTSLRPRFLSLRQFQISCSIQMSLIRDNEKRQHINQPEILHAECGLTILPIKMQSSV